MMVGQIKHSTSGEGKRITFLSLPSAQPSFLPEPCDQLVMGISIIPHEGGIPSERGSQAPVCSCPLYTPPATTTNGMV